MAVIVLDGIEFYQPEPDEIVPFEKHPYDCQCEQCTSAKNSRTGAFYNGVIWEKIL